MNRCTHLPVSLSYRPRTQKAARRIRVTSMNPSQLSAQFQQYPHRPNWKLRLLSLSSVLTVLGYSESKHRRSANMSSAKSILTLQLPA
ncbi:hypothetical protein TNCV_2403841 [Trichonephila clavipes]|nr:hypothetical protein TNCV_2403841 [Trichonephila clavipes]